MTAPNSPSVSEPRHEHGAMRGCPVVRGACPACGARSLGLGDGGYVTCASLSCPAPDAASAVLALPAALLEPPVSLGPGVAGQEAAPSKGEVGEAFELGAAGHLTVALGQARAALVLTRIAVENLRAAHSWQAGVLRRVAELAPAALPRAVEEGEGP